jgi:hypothetical protein
MILLWLFFGFVAFVYIAIRLFEARKGPYSPTSHAFAQPTAPSRSSGLGGIVAFFMVVSVFFATWFGKQRDKDGAAVLPKFVLNTPDEPDPQTQPKSGIVPGVLAEENSYYREDPVPQLVPAQAEPVAQPTATAIPKPWALILAHDPSLEKMQRLQRIFTKRNIQVIPREEAGLFLACILFQTNMEANAELNDWLRHEEDLLKFELTPQVVNLQNLSGTANNQVVTP